MAKKISWKIKPCDSVGGIVGANIIRPIARSGNKIIVAPMARWGKWYLPLHTNKIFFIFHLTFVLDDFILGGLKVDGQTINLWILRECIQKWLDCAAIFSFHIESISSFVNKAAHQECEWLVLVVSGFCRQLLIFNHEHDSGVFFALCFY